MDDLHDPSPEFLRFLEWQTRSELRRRARFGPHPARRPRGLRLVRTAALVAFSLCSGAGALYALERIQGSRELEVLVEGNRLRGEFTERRVEAARERLAALEQRHREGFVALGEVRSAEAQLAELELAGRHLALDHEELLAAGRRPDRRPSAPPVGGRDFVREHLVLDRDLAQLRVERRQEDTQAATLRHEAGATSWSDPARARLGELLARAELERLDRQLALRAEFRAGLLDAATCERRAMALDVEHQRTELEARADLTRRELERVEVLEEAGSLAGRSAPLREELERIELELRLTELQLESLR